MPITQSRMIALIDEAQELHGALRDLRANAQRFAEYLRDGLMTKEEVILGLQQAVANSRTADLEALPVEAAHFRKMQGHNQHRMLAQRAARGGLTIRREGTRAAPPQGAERTTERMLPQIAPDRAAMRKHIEAVLAKEYETPGLPPEQIHGPTGDPTTSALPPEVEVEGGMGEIPLGTDPRELL